MFQEQFALILANRIENVKRKALYTHMYTYIYLLPKSGQRFII